MKLTVYPEVVAGLGRGGEDLFLVFELDGDKPDLENVTKIEMELECGDGYDTEIEDERIKYWTHHYEHEWEGTKEDALELAKKEDEYESWERIGKVGDSPKIRLKRYVTGNAD